MTNSSAEACDRCGLLPGKAVVRLVRPGRPPERKRLCHMCLREGRLRASGPGRGDSFDRFMAEFLGRQPNQDDAAGAPSGAMNITRSFSDATRRLLQIAAEVCAEDGALDLDTDHLLCAILQDDTCARLLQAVEANVEGIAAEVMSDEDVAQPTDLSPALTPDTKGVLLAAWRESRELDADYIGPEHVLLGMVNDGDTIGARVLRRFGVSHAALRGAVIRGDRSEDERATQTPTLDTFGEDLTQQARDGHLDPVIGREEEIQQVIEVLSRRTKNNPVLLGDPGVGKTAIVEGIAQCIASGDIASHLAGRRLVALDLAGMVAGTSLRGEFEQRLKSVIEEIAAARDDLLVFIDEIHTIVGAGGAQGAIDAGTMLKPALSRGDLHVIGATTLDEYRTTVETDPALERRFQPIMVREPSSEQAVEILDGLKDRYEAFHRVRITDEAINAAVVLSARYIADRFLPDKAIDLIDQASARVRLRPCVPQTKALECELGDCERDKNQAVAVEDYERAAQLRGRISELRTRLAEQREGHGPVVRVAADDIAEVVSRRTGIPLSKLTIQDRQRLLGLEDHLTRRVIGQDDAVATVAEAVRRARAGLSDPDHPVGTFLFLGPTGVGKTELARTLAESLFGADDALIRLDMSEYQERHAVSRLIGAPPGYVGHGDAGLLTEPVRRRPHSIVLLDEIEKAHPDVCNVLLQVLDDGRLTDAQGRTVDFRNTITIMTSNLGAERIQGHSGSVVGFAPTGPEGGDAAFAVLREDLMGILRRSFRPEFLNRIDEVVVFRALMSPQLLRITSLLLDRLVDRLRGRGIGMEVQEDAVRWIAREGQDPDHGARPLRRTIQRHLETELSRLVLAEELGEGDLVVVTATDDGLAFDVQSGGNAEALEEWEERAPSADPVPAGPGAPRR
ncbi:ATP-dependent Clp protease ATP-binding subunit [soil metagenome]